MARAWSKARQARSISLAVRYSCKSTTSADTADALPLEIRNIIYAYISEEAKETLKRNSRDCSQFCIWPPQPQLDLSAVTLWSKDLYRRPDRGIIQTNRRLRQEYLPIYRQCGTVYTLLSSFMRYIQRFKNVHEVVLPSERLIVGFDRNHWGNVDIFLLLRLYGCNRALDLSFEHPRASTELFQALLNVRENAAWWKCLTERVHRIEISARLWYEEVEITIYVKDEYVESWMWEEVGPKESMRDWLQMAGLQELIGWKTLRVHSISWPSRDR